MTFPNAGPCGRCRASTYARVPAYGLKTMGSRGIWALWGVVTVLTVPFSFILWWIGGMGICGSRDLRDAARFRRGLSMRRTGRTSRSVGGDRRTSDAARRRRRIRRCPTRPTTPLLFQPDHAVRACPSRRPGVSHCLLTRFRSKQRPQRFTPFCPSCPGHSNRKGLRSGDIRTLTHDGVLASPQLCCASREPAVLADRSSHQAAQHDRHTEQSKAYEDPSLGRAVADVLAIAGKEDEEHAREPDADRGGERSKGRKCEQQPAVLSPLALGMRQARVILPYSPLLPGWRQNGRS